MQKGSLLFLCDQPIPLTRKQANHEDIGCETGSEVTLLSQVSKGYTTKYEELHGNLTTENTITLDLTGFTIVFVFHCKAFSTHKMLLHVGRHLKGLLLGFDLFYLKSFL